MDEHNAHSTHTHNICVGIELFKKSTSMYYVHKILITAWG